MSNNKDLSLTRIGVFYDGNYFLHVSNYYNYSHERKSRLSVAGLHHFIRREVAQQESTDERLCQIVDAHYFRGRLTAGEAQKVENSLYYDRIFDDILSSEGVTTHFMPVKIKNGVRHEKGIDVWLALEAFELAFYKRFNVLVLIASDGDYVPLIRKLNTLGTRVMVLSWDFQYTNNQGQLMTTRTSQDLLEEVTYPVAMHEIIENRVKKNDPLINNLFVPKPQGQQFAKQRILTTPRIDNRPQTAGSSNNGTQASTSSQLQTADGKKISTIKGLKEGFGFINNQPKDCFFFHSSLVDYDFNDLVVGDKVAFKEEILPDGRYVAKEITVVE